MPHDTDHNLVPRAPRFKVVDSSDVLVTITRTEESDSPTLHAELVDVSQHGAKLRVPVNLRFEEAVQLNIEVIGTELGYKGIASVRHIRALDEQGSEEHWLVGCAVAPALSDETFSYLATNSGAERRRFRRLPVAAEVTVRRQTQTEGCPATLHNLSSGGFCFSSHVQFEVNERVQLSIDDAEGHTHVVEARICWQIDSPENSIAGCQFTSSNSYAEVCGCLIEQPGLNPGMLRAPTSKLVLSAAILAMFLPPMMTLLFQAKKVAADAVVEQPTEVVAELADATEEATEKATKQVTHELETDIPASQAEPDSEQQPVVAELVLREWVDNTGKHRTLAALVEVTPEHVVLEKANGKRVKVPWRRLSEADQQLARERSRDPIADSI